MNKADIILTVILCAAVGAALWIMVKQKKKGGCCGNCERCNGCLPPKNESSG